MSKLPKAIAQHPAVQSVESGEVGGFDYRYDVWLRAEWVFTSGRHNGCRGGRFNTVREFLDAAPRRLTGNK